MSGLVTVPVILVLMVQCVLLNLVWWHNLYLLNLVWWQAQPFADLSSYIMSAPPSDLFFQPKLDQASRWGRLDRTESRKQQLDKISHTWDAELIMPNDITWDIYMDNAKWYFTAPRF